jgi:hypothetical protein|uniref:Uncharacterized protein n=1 Tax=Sipha flava TaxID=143950 RepID=A0A2S2PVS0_9HEMI
MGKVKKKKIKKKNKNNSNWISNKPTEIPKKPKKGEKYLNFLRTDRLRKRRYNVTRVVDQFVYEPKSKTMFHLANRRTAWKQLESCVSIDYGFRARESHERDRCAATY